MADRAAETLTLLTEGAVGDFAARMNTGKIADLSKKAKLAGDSKQLVAHRFDIAEKIIEVRARYKLMPDDLGAVELDRLYAGGSKFGARSPNSMNISVSLNPNRVNSVKKNP